MRRRSRGLLVASMTLSLTLSLTLSPSPARRGSTEGCQERAAPGRGRVAHRRGREEPDAAADANAGRRGASARMRTNTLVASSAPPNTIRPASARHPRGRAESGPGLGGFRERFHRRGDPRVPAHGGDAVVFHPVVVPSRAWIDEAGTLEPPTPDGISSSSSSSPPSRSMPYVLCGRDMVVSTRERRLLCRGRRSARRPNGFFKIKYTGLARLLGLFPQILAHE